MNLGYACINMTLSNQRPKITTNRSMIKRTFLSKGINYASELSLLNSIDLLKILKWNNDNDIKLFRMSSDIFPWFSEWNLEDAPDHLEIRDALKACGDFAKENNIRITSHPGPFNVLVSPNERVINNTITDLENNGKILDIMGFEPSHYNKINIHCNGVYGDKISAMDRFVKNFDRLSDSVKLRLTVENDDKGSMYSVKDLMYIHERIGIPIVFDYHHHKFQDGGLSEREALEMAIKTWPDGITPVVHYSESKAIHENNSSIKEQAHSDMINELPNLYGNKVDVMIEAKSKELNILKFKKPIITS